MSLECRECERDIRGGHDPSCSHYDRRVCNCGHLAEQHDDDDGWCEECHCVAFELPVGGSK